MKELGEKIRETRLKRGLSQKQLADKIGVAKSTVSLYENGKCKISIKNLMILAIELNTTVNFLLDLEY